MTRPFIRTMLLLAMLALAGCTTTQQPATDTGSLTTFEQARTVYLAGDYPRAFELMLQEANLGNPHAQYTVGYMYYNGQGVKEDMDQALKWIRQAAAEGDARALEALGTLAKESMKPEEPLQPAKTE